MPRSEVRVATALSVDVVRSKERTERVAVSVDCAAGDKRVAEVRDVVAETLKTHDGLASMACLYKGVRVEVAQ